MTHGARSTTSTLENEHSEFSHGAIAVDDLEVIGVRGEAVDARLFVVVVLVSRMTSQPIEAGYFKNNLWPVSN